MHAVKRRIAALLAAALLGGAVGPAQAELERQVRFSLTAHNATAAPLSGQELWFYVPRDMGRQQLKSLRVNAPHRVVEDAVGNTIVAVTYDQLPPYATRIIQVTAQLELGKAPAAEGEASSRYLGAEPLVQTDDPEIRKLAEQLRRGSPLETAQAIYDWVSGNLEYAGYVADDLGALHAYQARRGDCTEYAYLAAALARANGIPARIVGGYVTDRDAVLQARTYHNWAEVLVDNRWEILDAQKGTWREKSDQYVAFHVLGDSSGPMGTAHRYRVRGAMTVKME